MPAPPPLLPAAVRLLATNGAPVGSPVGSSKMNVWPATKSQTVQFPKEVLKRTVRWLTWLPQPEIVSVASRPVQGTTCWCGRVTLEKIEPGCRSSVENNDQSWPKVYLVEVKSPCSKFWYHHSLLEFASGSRNPGGFGAEMCMCVKCGRLIKNNLGEGGVFALDQPWHLNCWNEYVHQEDLLYDSIQQQVKTSISVHPPQIELEPKLLDTPFPGKQVLDSSLPQLFFQNVLSPVNALADDYPSLSSIASGVQPEVLATKAKGVSDGLLLHLSIKCSPYSDCNNLRVALRNAEWDYDNKVLFSKFVPPHQMTVGAADEHQRQLGKQANILRSLLRDIPPQLSHASSSSSSTSEIPDQQLVYCPPPVLKVTTLVFGDASSAAVSFQKCLETTLAKSPILSRTCLTNANAVVCMSLKEQQFSCVVLMYGLYGLFRPARSLLPSLVCELTDSAVFNAAKTLEDEARCTLFVCR
eukprot:TRINITY_DN177_c1_g2_i4.p1 TRINITY_DN177_c1_g2~~TRINITY_DN177_c1_g2_i4.p1  ORF type:complete len:538 (-),score=142.42 TRINITY_DN177_c1_g2_i4:87-1493(-)